MAKRGSARRGGRGSGRGEGNNANDNKNPNISAVIAQQLTTLIPTIFTQVAGAMESAIQKAGTLTDEMVRNETLTRSSEKRKQTGESSNQGNTRSNNKRVRSGKIFVATKPNRKEYRGPHPKCKRCNYHHHASAPCYRCTKCNQVSHYTKDCRANVRQPIPLNTVNPRVCYECGDPHHFRNTCPRLNRTFVQGNNPNQVQAIRGNNRENNGNQALGRAFVIGTNEARQEPNLVTGTFPLNNHYASVLFDSGADYSFISTEFASLLNIEPYTLDSSCLIKNRKR